MSGTLEIFVGKQAICRRILQDLPEWFGIPESIESYAQQVDRFPMLGCVRDGEIVGFIALKVHNHFVAEAYVLGVQRRWQRQGVGRMLFDHTKDYLRNRGFSYLTVKTVLEERTGEAYAQTRRFYEAVGFVPVEVFPDLWAHNPCLLMIFDLK